MKEFALKHPIITFLFGCTLISEVMGTIRAFAPNRTEADVTTEVTVEPEIEIETNEEEAE